MIYKFIDLRFLNLLQNLIELDELILKFMQEYKVGKDIQNTLEEESERTCSLRCQDFVKLN